MLNKTAYLYGSQRSAIRELFEYGNKKRAELGADKVYDFSLGNPSVPAPIAVQKAFERIVTETDPVQLHGYTSAQGSIDTRRAIASVMTARSGMTIRPENLYLTCGAAASLSSCFGALTVDSKTEFLAIAPFFPEYKVFAEVLGASLRVVPADEVSFRIDLEALSEMINENTQGVIINSPNNPSGVIYPEETLRALAAILREKSAAYGHPIYLISDEPYRELYYTENAPAFLPSIYSDTLICYSYSKSFSLPGERIGYVCVPDCVTDAEMVYAAVAGAARRFGYVCAPSLLQRVVTECADVLPDLTVYKRNRDLLYTSLTEMGYDCVNPDGAFYLFVRSPMGDGAAFSEKAKAENVLVVPGAGFGAKNHIRIAYCDDTDRIERALPPFTKLI